MQGILPLYFMVSFGGAIAETPPPPKNMVGPRHSQHYSHDGWGNNLAQPHLGSAGRPRIRSHPPLTSYIDGVSKPRTESDGLPPAWRVSSELFRGSARPKESKGVSQLLLYFGQMVVHDLMRTEMSSEDGEAMHISCGGAGTCGEHGTGVVTGFGFGCPAAAFGGGGGVLPFFRALRSNTTPGEPQSPINYESSFLDLSMLYGLEAYSSKSKLRSGVGGRMMLDTYTGLPPRDVDTGLYIVADLRTRGTPGLLVLTSLFIHYHNLCADAHRDSNQTFTDDELYRLARMDNIAAYQHIVEEVYVPTVLGDHLGPYEGYDKSVDPSIDVFFSTCAFRYGHSGLSGLVRLVHPSFRPMAEDPMLLRDVFNNTEKIMDELGARVAATAILRGLAFEPAQAIDAYFVKDVALFTGHMSVMNIQRSRDNGLPTYNDARDWFDMGRVKTFEELAGNDVAVSAALRELYDSVDDVDAYVGALLEAPNASTFVLGPLMMASIKDQFRRLRDGDRLWYKGRLTPEEQIKLPSLKKMLIDAFGEDDMEQFPSDSFAAVSVALGGSPQRTYNSTFILLRWVYT